LCIKIFAGAWDTQSAQANQKIGVSNPSLMDSRIPGIAIILSGAKAEPWRQKKLQGCYISRDDSYRLCLYNPCLYNILVVF
jgi:hypothetical protein